MVETTASAASAPSAAISAARSAPKVRNFNDKEKPMEVRQSNIIAAKGKNKIKVKRIIMTIEKNQSYKYLKLSFPLTYSNKSCGGCN